MPFRRARPVVLVCGLLAAAVTGISGAPALAPDATLAAAPAALRDAQRLRRDLRSATQAAAAARRRALTLEAQAARQAVAAGQLAAQSAALAARVQEAEAVLAASVARTAIARAALEDARSRLAAGQAPAAEAVAALQRLSRTPPALAVLRTGTSRQAVRTRALLAGVLPQVRERTDDLRADAARLGRSAEAARQAARSARQARAELIARRRGLAAAESRYRNAALRSGSLAAGQEDIALALGERSVSLEALLGQLSDRAARRDRLAALPGPVMPPWAGGGAKGEQRRRVAASTAPRLVLPVAGALRAGFGEQAGGPGGVPSRGIEIASGPQAQAVAPGAGKVAFAAPYRGYGHIVILEHGGGWTSLVTGLARTSVRAGDEVIAGSPLGATGRKAATVRFELRRRGVPVNPLDHLGAL